MMGVVGLFVGVVVAIVAEVVPDRSGGGHSVRTCGSCGEAISPKSLILVRSKASTCLSCGARAPASRLPIVLTTAVAFAIIASIVGIRWQLIPILLLTASLIALSAVDMARYRLPDRLVFPSLGASLVVLAALSIANDAGDHVVRAVMTGLAYAGMLFVFNMIYPAGLAFGDVKLALLLGLFLGWSATNGVDALRLAREHHPDLVVTDLQMPGGDGLSLCLKLNEQPDTAAIPVIMLTGRGYKVPPSDLVRTNIKSMVPKPFSPRQLLGKVREFLP